MGRGKGSGRYDKGKNLPFKKKTSPRQKKVVSETRITKGCVWVMVGVAWLIGILLFMMYKSM